MEERLQINMEEYERFSCMKDLQGKLKKDLSISVAPFKIVHHYHKYIYVRCQYRGCEWQLRYKFEITEDAYLLRHRNMTHSHDILNSYTLRCKIIEKFIDDLPNELTMRAAKTLALKHLKIT